MTGAAAPHHVHAILHCNLNTVDSAAEIAFYGELDFALRMSNLTDDTDATPLGLGEHTASLTDFIYDKRGPRAAPALEFVEWRDPATVPTPPPATTRLGIEAGGLRAASLEALKVPGPVADETVERWVRGALRPTLLTTDPDGVTIEIVEIAGAPDDPDAVMFSHVRTRCRDLAASIAWYEAIGWRQVASDQDPAEGVSLVIPEDPTFSVELVSDPDGEPALPAANSQGLYRMALAVDDVDVAYEGLREAGIELKPPVFMPMPDVPTGGFTVLFLRDPDGVVVEMVARPRSSMRRPQQPV